MHSLYLIAAMVFNSFFQGSEPYPNDTRGISTSTTTVIPLIDFSSSARGGWQLVNDDVMGGVSTSRLSMLSEGYALFSGNVSLRNNGGFASMRTRAQAPANLSDYEGLLVRVLGDGKTYLLSLKTLKNGRVTWYRFEARFATVAGEWHTHQLPFSAFKAVFRGSDVRGNPALNTDAIIELGFMIRDGQEGPFQLGISTVSVYR